MTFLLRFSDSPFDLSGCILKGFYGGVRLYLGQGVDHGTILYIPEHIQPPGFAVCSEQTLEGTNRLELAEELRRMREVFCDPVL